MSRCICVSFSPGEMVALDLGSEVVTCVSPGAGQPCGNSLSQDRRQGVPKGVLGPNHKSGRWCRKHYGRWYHSTVAAGGP